jgi:ferredoxin
MLQSDGAPPDETHVFVGLRHGGVHAFRGELADIATRHPKLHARLLQRAEAGRRAQPRLRSPRSRRHRASGGRCPPVLPLLHLRATADDGGAALLALTAWGVPDAHIHHEAFGPASVTRVATATTRAASAATTREVVFEKSSRTIAWTPDSGTLLDCAAAHGIVLDAGCRAGNCGTCAVAVREGTVTYRTQPGVTLETGTCLTCCAVPESSSCSTPKPVE